MAVLQVWALARAAPLQPLAGVCLHLHLASAVNREPLEDMVQHAGKLLAFPSVGQFATCSLTFLSSANAVRLLVDALYGRNRRLSAPKSKCKSSATSDTACL